MCVCMKLLLIIPFKPLYTYLIRYMNKRLNSHKPLFSTFVVINIVPKLDINWKKKIELIEQFIFKGTHQNGFVSLFYLKIIISFQNACWCFLVLIWRAQISRVLLNNERHRLSMQIWGEILIDRKYWKLHFPRQKSQNIDWLSKHFTTVDIMYDLTTMTSAHAIVVFSTKEVWILISLRFIPEPA